MTLEQDLAELLQVHGVLARARVRALAVGWQESNAAREALWIENRFERKRTEFLARWSASVAHQDGAPKL